jgi:hypothetical protein
MEQDSSLSRILRFVFMAILLLVIIGGIVWFFFLRSPSEKPENGRDTTRSPTSQTNPNPRQDQPTNPAPTTTTPQPTPATGGSTPSNPPLAATGPGDLAGLFAMTFIAGVAGWQWRLRRRAATE